MEMMLFHFKAQSDVISIVKEAVLREGMQFHRFVHKLDFGKRLIIYNY